MSVSCNGRVSHGYNTVQITHSRRQRGWQKQSRLQPAGKCMIATFLQDLWVQRRGDKLKYGAATLNIPGMSKSALRICQTVV